MCTRQDSMNELIIWKMKLLVIPKSFPNSFVIPLTGVKFKAAFLHA